MDLARYQLERLREDQDFVLYRARAHAPSATILMLVPTPRHIEQSSLERLEHEYSLAAVLDPAWAVMPSALVRYGRRTALVFDDPGGHLLAEILAKPLELMQFLSIAVSLVTAIREIHRHGLIHNDIKPSNILVDETNEARLTGFTFWSRLARQRQAPAAPETLQGTLAYMAPERTGRINRSIDARSDLYSLGVTLYEMLVGALPFASSDPMEVVHCHVARRPPAPSERVKGIAPTLESLILKLLAKNAEDRYQTAAGVEFDLRRCLSALRDVQVIEPFDLGERDIGEQLLIPERLYCRETEFAALLRGFERAATQGRFDFVLVSGPSGIGKSSIVNELRRALQTRRALFAEGRSDQFKRDIPYASVAEAFRGLLRVILSQDDLQLDRWRASLLQAVGSYGRLLVDLIPELGLVLGDQPALPSVSPEEERSRFGPVFRRFLGVFARPEHPLVLFLDDLQWIDGATLQFLERLACDEEIQYLFLIGTYRTDDPEALQGLRTTISAISTAKGAPKEIELAPLSCADTARLIADTLHTDNASVYQLAELVVQKTQGNCFFVRQFLTAINAQGLLRFEPVVGAWRWDLEAIRNTGITDNVAVLMATRLARYDTVAREALKRLACLGTGGQASTIARILGLAEEAIHDALADAVRDDLLHRLGTTYAFSHDRVREAAYALIPVADKGSLHLRTARVLVDSIEQKAVDDGIFEIVNHYNQGKELLESPDEKAYLAQLNLTAGRRAKAAAAYDSARRYLSDGCALLGPDDLDLHPQLRFELEFHLADCNFILGNIAVAEECLSGLLSRHRNPTERALIVGRLMILYTNLGEIERAIALALSCLEEIGERLPLHPTDSDLDKEYRSLLTVIGSRSIDSLVDLPSMTDTSRHTVIELLEALTSPAGVFDMNLISLAQLRMAHISIQFGHTDSSTHAYAGLARLLGWRIGSFDIGQGFGRLAIRLVDDRGYHRCAERVYSILAAVMAPYTMPLMECHDLAVRATQLGPEHGGVSFAGYSWALVVSFLFDSGQPLLDVQRRAEAAEAQVAQRKFLGALLMITLPLMLVRALRGLNSEFGSFTTNTLAEKDFERQLTSDINYRHTLARYWTRKLQLRFYAGDLPACLHAIHEVQHCVGKIPLYELVCEFCFFAALTHAAILTSQVEPRSDPRFDELRQHHAQLEEWAVRCPVNFEDRACLVAAESARLEGRTSDAGKLYEDAIRLSSQHGFIQNQGLANELAARFYAPLGFIAIADAYARNARACYLRWGADGKVRQLDQVYPHLTEEVAPRTTSKADASSHLQRMDVAAVIEMHQAVSRELVLDRLIERLMVTVVEHAGAVRGLVLLSQDADLHIVAEAVTSHNSVTVHLRHQAATFGELPQSVLNFVTRTQDFLILDDALATTVHSSDEYVVRVRPRSILCLPLVKQKRLVGVLYLENTLSSHVFTADRLTVLRLIASQAAISIENAVLFRDVQKAQQQARLVGDELRRSFDMIPALAWRASPDGKFEFANRQWHDYTGITPDDAMGGTWMRSLHPDDLEKVQAAWIQLLVSGAAGEVEARMRRFDGEFRSFLVRATPLHDDRGNVVVWHGTNTDIESLKRTEQAQQALARVSRLTAMGELTVSIAHEVSQPLMAIETNATTCLRWLANEQPNIPKARSAAERIIGDAHRARDVITSIRALARKAAPQTIELNLNEIIVEVLQLTRNEIERHGIHAEVDLAIDAGRVQGSRVQLQQVVLNLVMNAIEALSAKESRSKHLQLRSARVEAAHVLVSVLDSGIGVDAIHCDRVFEAFFTTKSEGLGMGLSICRSIIEAHNGRLWVEPNSPCGSIFNFRLPTI